MLIEFYGKNFGCFRDEFRLSMLATDIEPGSQRGIIEVEIDGDDEPLRLLRCAAIYGPNASGKSTVIRAATALNFLISSSLRFESDAPIGPFEPFRLESRSQRKPVMLGLQAVVSKKVLEYRVEFDHGRFRHELLIEHGTNGPVELFSRNGQQEVTGKWTENKRFSLLSSSFRHNVLLLSLADRVVPDLARDLAVSFRRLLRVHDACTSFESQLPGFGRAARLARTDKKFGGWMLGLLRSADLGIVSYKIKDEEVEIAPLLRADDQEGAVVPPARQIEPRLTFVHAGKESSTELPYLRESNGTRALVERVPYLYELTHGKSGSVWFMDELDASLHPNTLEFLIRLFNNDLPIESIKGQLIFTTHETALMDGEASDAALRRDQIWFTEKVNGGASRLYSLAEYKERQNLNMRRRYLQGRYGALPAIGTFGE